MAQLVFKAKRRDAWTTIKRIGEYDTTNVVVPREKESVVLLDENSNATVYSVVHIEYVYAQVLNEFRLYHVLVFVEPGVFFDSNHLYQRKREYYKEE